MIMYAIKDQNGRWFNGFKFRRMDELERRKGVPIFDPKTIPDFSTRHIMLLTIDEIKEAMADLESYKSVLSLEVMEIVPISVPQHKD